MNIETVFVVMSITWLAVVSLDAVFAAVTRNNSSNGLWATSHPLLE